MSEKLKENIQKYLLLKTQDEQLLFLLVREAIIEGRFQMLDDLTKTNSSNSPS